jgi:hypothetical protein
MSPRSMAAGRRTGGNREVPPPALRDGVEANSGEEGGAWGKHGLPHATEPEAEEAAMERSRELAAGEP